MRGGIERIPLPPVQVETLREFPTMVINAGTEVWRVHRVENGPWWFHRGGRFGLDSPRGTCYVATDPMTAISEALVRGNPIVQESILEAYCIRRLPIPRRILAANLKDRKAGRYKVTRNFGTEEPYDRTQEWARIFVELRLGGINYWPRHDLKDDTSSLAIFGSVGERKSWRRGRAVRLIESDWRVRIETELGVAIEALPSDEDMEFVKP